MRTPRPPSIALALAIAPAIAAIAAVVFGSAGCSRLRADRDTNGVVASLAEGLGDLRGGRRGTASPPSSSLAAPAAHPADPSPSAADEPTWTWSLPDAQITLRHPQVSADGAGAWRVTMSADVRGTTVRGIEWDAERIALTGESERLTTPFSHAIRIRGGESIRRELVWRVRAVARPTEATLVWFDARGGAAGVRTVVLSAGPAVPFFARSIASAPEPLRIAVDHVESHTPGYGSVTLRVHARVTNESEEPIEISLQQFRTYVPGAGATPLVPAATTTGYDPGLVRCRVTGTLMPDRVTLRPGDSVEGNLCFSRGGAVPTNLVRFTHDAGDDENAHGFSAYFLVTQG